MPVADLILKNARVITMDNARPDAEIVAIKGDRIIFVGGNDSLESVRGAGTRVMDCAGKTVVPGFNDAHCHIYSLMRQLQSIDISPASVRSIEDIKAAIFRKARQTPQGRWITASGYNDFYLAEKRHPTRWDIDDVSPDHPVALLHRSLHACVLNSRALALAGISGETEEPLGATIERDRTSGEPNGLLFEMVGHISRQVLPPLSDEELDSGIALVNSRCLSQGITSLQDATVNNDYSRWLRFRSFTDSGRLKSRLYMMFGMDALNQFQEAGLTSGYGDAQLRLSGVKIVLTDDIRALYPPQTEINRMVLAAHRAGFQMAIHAVQQETVAAAIASLEYALGQIPRPHRHRIEHCAECPPHLLERLKRLQTVVVTQPPFLYYSGERYLATVSPDRQPWLYRIRSLIDSGLVVAASSDSPIAPDNPLTGIYAAVTRKAQTGQQVLPGERISATQALAMYTINAAYASFEEGIKGSITEGKLADLVLLSADPRRIAPEQIKEIKVEMTILGGGVVWEG
ncbi:MAG: amidohydrolase [Chloroflexi bacterium]|nr:amidohydrolase [Chloroflexota bacterium]